MTRLFSMLRFTASSVALVFLLHSPCAHAFSQELQDEDLSAVSAGDGVSISFHLEWNANALTNVNLSDTSSISVGFYDDAAKRHTSLIFQGFGGILDMWNLSIDAKSGPASVGDYVEITLPNFMAFKQFGFRGLYAESYVGSTPPATPQEPLASYGRWLLNGSATVTGSAYIWPSK